MSRVKYVPVHFFKIGLGHVSNIPKCFLPFPSKVHLVLVLYKMSPDLEEGPIKKKLQKIPAKSVPRKSETTYSKRIGKLSIQPKQNKPSIFPMTRSECFR